MATGKAMRGAWVAAALLAVATGCGTANEGTNENAGGSGGSGGSGGTGGSIGEPTAAELCEASCQPMVDCGMLPREYMKDCVDLCTSDPAFDPGRQVGCVACLEQISCDDILTGCLEVCEAPRFDLTVTLPAGEASGELFVAIQDEHTGALGSIRSSLIGEDGSASIALGADLVQRRAVLVHAFVDSDLDGACGEDDRTWTVRVPGPEANVEVTLGVDAEVAPAACDAFATMDRDFTALGTGFDDFEGKAAVVALKVNRFGMPQTMQGNTFVQNGTLAVPFGRVIAADASYQFVWFIDVDGDGRCTPDGDRGGMVEIPSPHDEHVRLEFDPSSGGAPSCDRIFNAGFDLALSGTGFGQFDGALANATLVDGETGEYRTSALAAIQDGSFTIELLGDLAYGFAHRVSLWIDSSGDGFCGEGDQAWWIEIPAAEGDATATFAYTPALDLDACSVQMRSGDPF